jgi:hypothetical protein
VIFCHIDYDGRTTIGNVQKNSLQDIVSDPAFLEMTNRFMADGVVASDCERCRGVKASQIAV